MTKSPTLLLSKMSALFKILSDRSIDVEEFLSSEGVDPLKLNSPNSRITLHKAHSIMNRAVTITGDKELGLHQGEIFPGLPSILCYVIMSCQDLGMAIEKLCKYQAIADETKRLDLMHEDNLAVIRVTYPTDYYDKDKQLVDYQMCGLYSFFKLLTGNELLLKEVRFRHAAPDNISEYKRIFNCRLFFESDANAIVIDKGVLETSLLQPNKDLLLQFEQLAEKVLQNYIGSKSYTHQIVRIILEYIGESSPSIKTAAKQMGISVRNLQLKLKSEGTTYTKILNEIRTDLAKEHLNDQQVAISEISYLLGFSEPSVFHKFFKKQTGDTPYNYRQKLSYGYF